MNVQNIQSIGFDSRLKELYKKGKIKLKVGLYGEKLTKKNVSDEHIKPRSWGGTNDENNIALTSKEANCRRGNAPIELFLTYGMLRNYLKQFIDVFVDGFDGNKYIQGVKETIRDLIE